MYKHIGIDGAPTRVWHLTGTIPTLPNTCPPHTGFVLERPRTGGTLCKIDEFYLS